MTFLNPFVLFGLAAAAIPLILHLLNLRKLRTIEFSTLAFLKELQQTKIRRLKLKQLLLLIIRTLIIIFIVLAFSRPALRSTMLGGIGTHAHSSIILILDDSFSMSVHDEQGELIKQAKEAAINISELLKDGDEVYLIRLSNPETADIIPPHDYDIFKTAINESKISLIKNSAESALRLSAKIMSKSKNANKEIYLISDFQGSMIFEKSNGDITSKTSLFENDIKLFLINIGNRQIQNTGIDSIKVITKILEKNRPVEIEANVKNLSSLPRKDFVASLYFDNVRVAQKSIDIESWSSSLVSFTAIPKNSGYIRGFVQLENDDLEYDNKRYFTLYIPERIRTAFAASTTGDFLLLKLALKASDSENLESLFEIPNTHTSQISTVDMKNIDLLAILNLKNLSGFEIDKIKSFIQQGGGLIIFPGNDSQVENLNQLLSRLEIPIIEGISKTSKDAGLTFQKVDFDHPIFSGVFESINKRSKKNIESPQVYMALRRNTGKQGHSIITLSNGDAFLSEYKFGEGRILIFSTAPDYTWSNFPLKGIFAPLIYRSFVYAASGKEMNVSYIVGQDAGISLKQDFTGSTKWIVRYPDGVEEFITGPKEFQHIIPLVKLSQAGIYELSDGSKTTAIFAANVDAAESDLRKISDEELSKLWEIYNVNPDNIHWFNVGEKIQEKVLASRYGVELWKYAIAFVLFLAFIEMLIARDRKRDNVQ